ncbi:hypothetical protein LTR02_003576 [Friedmanniomyces endolithicus]|nr:hypothetical protein LTR38_003019 [Friedmanniomyces endolithicus]KAK0843668.1 hypothetical protein LTR03_008481 [Friedmanniomyces endolithicus]KAK0878625.1 hypothetical protein LTR87_007486 [Friedmanniomyces endolithicus]KAK0911138.1 hypothetical protein LTR02_003576 [Friedmanniomyces endolithicus]KAK1040291.1 hypothetical protein LTS16_010506 [Friedmanniomyces endolithicus]
MGNGRLLMERLILIFPLLFTAGMFTVAVALVIGALQLLNLILSVKPDLTGSFWHGVEVAGKHYDVIGGGICGSFVVFGLLSALLHRPWRTMIDYRRHVTHPIANSELDMSREDNTTVMQPPSLDTTKSHATVAKNGTPHRIEERVCGPATSVGELD